MQWQAFEIKEHAIFIPGSEDDAVYVSICGELTQNLLQERVIAYLF